MRATRMLLIVLALLATLPGSAMAWSLTVTPNSSLVRSGQTVFVSGTGFTPNDTIGIEQCRRAGPNSRSCNGLDTADSDDSGSFSDVVFVSYSSPYFISCEDPYCTIEVFTSDFGPATTPISFAGSSSTTSTPSPGSGGTIALGQFATDAAVVTGNGTSGSPTGQMEFFVCGPGPTPPGTTCDRNGSAVPGNPRPLTPGPDNTASAVSGQFTPTAPGTYCFRGVYLGDASYGASFDSGVNECFYAKASTTTTSTPSAQWGAPRTPFTDTAVVAGTLGGGPPTGTVSFYLCGPNEPAGCTQGGTFISTNPLTAAPYDTARATSDVAAPPIPPGRWCWRSEYSGSNFYFPSADTSTSECFVVGGYPRPKGATPLRMSLVPAYVQCTAPNRAHGPPLSFQACGPPVLQPGSLTLGTADANGGPANSTGLVLLNVIAGDPSTQQNEADARITTSITDVRRRSDLSDYPGELRTVLSLRLTDYDPQPGPDVPQTTQDFPFGVTVPCTTTAATTVGSTCALATTADTVMPGAVPEGQRSIWALDQVKVYDGGADDDADTLADNNLFEVQGVFVP